MRKLFLLLALIVAGAQSAWAYDYVGKYADSYGNEYYVYSEPGLFGGTIYTASLAAINATGDVVISSPFDYFNVAPYFSFKASVNYVGWWLDQQKAEDITSTANMTSLSLPSVVIHGHFTLSNLYGPITLGRGSTIASDAILDIPHATQFLKSYLKIDGTVKAPAITSLVIPQETTISTSGSIIAQAATQLTVNGVVSGSISTPQATQLDISQGAKVYGSISAMATKVNIASGTQVTGLLYVPLATNIVMDANSFYGTISSNSLTSIKLGQTNFGTSGKLQSSNLRDIYIPSKTALPTFYGQYSDHFTAPSGSITVHVYDMTANEIAAMKNSMVWNGFKQIVNHKSNVNYTIVSDGNARIDFVELKGNASYVSATGISQIAFTSSGSKSGSVKSGGNYAVEIRDVDFDTKNVQLLRNGSVATLEPYEDQGQPLRYHEDLDLQQDVRYEVSVSDKVCTVSFAQTGYTGRIMYQKTWNGTTSTGVITAYAPTVTCAQGSQLKLTIPYDQYTPNVLRLNGSTVSMTKANGEATATITVPAAATAEVDLIWQAPQQTYTSHQPQIMIMRSGEGQVVFKGAAFLSSEWQQYIDDYEQSGLIIDERDEGSWVISGNGPVNCSQTVNTVTAPDVDPSGEVLDESSWGFIVEMTPVAGQKLKTFLIGQISGGEELLWDDMLFGDYSESNYITYNESTNTYTFDLRGDYMNYAAGDYVVNIVMGPEETAVETGKTLNFVRQGGRGDSFIEWYDESGRDFFFTEGSTSKTIPNEELQDDDLKMYIDIEEGEVLHVYKNGADITSQFQLNGQSTTQYWAPLEEESATYTLLIDDAPDANPTWTIHNATEGDVIVEQTLKDGTTTTTTYAGNLNDLVIDDTQVSKVTLKVYAENANEAKPVRVLVNGQDVSYQFSTKQNDGDGFRLCYEVPVSELTNCNWDISYNTDRPQTFVVKGGTCNLLMEFYYENLESEPVLDISPNDGPATVYLPPFNSEWNRYVNMTVNADEYEGLTIKRNGIDVTNYFTKTVQSNGKKYYELDIAEGDLEGNSTVGLLSFDIREAAVWEIVYKSVEEQMKTLRVSNLDQMEIVYERNYTDGSTASEYFKNSETGEIAEYVERIFDDSDRENTSSVYLKVPIDEGNPIRVMLNGEDVTYSQYDEWINGDWVSYIASMAKDQTWNISYDTSHKQTFIVKGGLYPEVNYEYKTGDITKDVQVGGITEVCLPDYNPDYDNGSADFTIGTLPNESFTALRNGVDVTDKFIKELRDNIWVYRFDFDNAEVAAALGIDLRDPAVWQITIGDTGRYDLNNDNKVDISDVTKLVNKVLNR